MNERIRLLAEQAKLYAEEQYPGSFVKYDPKWFEFYNEKFAELIVKKCVDIANKQFSAASGLDDRDSWTAAEIKQHFGVEE